MLRTTKVSGVKEMRVLLRSHPERLEREFGSVLRQAARALSIEYGLATDPPDIGGESSVEKFKARIEGELKVVYPTRDDETQIYRLLLKHAPHLARAYWHAFKSSKPNQMAAILRQAGGLPQGGANARQLKEWRTARRGRVDKRKGAAAMVRSHEQRRIIREQQGLIGTAKAGWHQAAKALGGRARRNYDFGKRTTVEAFPAYVRKVSRKFSGLGGAIIRTDSITIFTNVRHGVDALEAGLKAGAEAKAQENFQKAMAIALSQVNKKYFEKAA